MGFGLPSLGSFCSPTGLGCGLPTSAPPCPWEKEPVAFTYFSYHPISFSPPPMLGGIIDMPFCTLIYVLTEQYS